MYYYDYNKLAVIKLLGFPARYCTFFHILPFDMYTKNSWRNGKLIKLNENCRQSYTYEQTKSQRNLTKEKRIYNLSKEWNLRVCGNWKTILFLTKVFLIMQWKRGETSKQEIENTQQEFPRPCIISKSKYVISS